MKLNFIEKKRIDGRLDKLIVRSPVDGQPLMAFHQASPSEVEEAVRSARRALGNWSLLELEQRISILKKYAQLLELHLSEISELISRETGKPEWEAVTEVKAMIGKIPLSIDAYHERSSQFGNAPSITRFKPHGVMAIFGPFNFPGHLPNGHIIPALLAGNTVVFKPSELAPSAGIKIIELLSEAGLPKGVANLLMGAKETAVSLANHPMIDGLFFTGSAEVGDHLRESFARNPGKILALELGGNNPLVVWDVKDTTAAVLMTIQSAFITAGQRCTCARRLIVPNNKEGNHFIGSLVRVARDIVVGAPSDEVVPFMGPVINVRMADRILEKQQALCDAGAKSLLETKLLKSGSAFLSPGIIDVTDVQNRQDEEIFGPLLQVIRVNDFEEAIEEANNTSFGLASGILTDDRNKYETYYQHARAGLINWNKPLTGASGAAPFGGIGRSGNFRPSAFFAADYCSYPVASLESEKLLMPDSIPPGLKI